MSSNNNGNSNSSSGLFTTLMLVFQAVIIVLHFMNLLPKLEWWQFWLPGLLAFSGNIVLLLLAAFAAILGIVMTVLGKAWNFLSKER